MARASHSIVSGYNGYCEIIGVADGDTIRIRQYCDCQETFHEFTLRIANIESWEIIGVNKNSALVVQSIMKKKYLGKRGELFIKHINCDRYGRAVGDLRINGTMLSQLIVEQGLGWYINNSKKAIHNEHFNGIHRGSHDGAVLRHGNELQKSVYVEYFSSWDKIEDPKQKES
jgi:endonuclease YncB( thermonuclease family)